MIPLTKHPRRGVALVLVISAIAISSILGFALLSGAMLQTRTRGNAARSAQAEYLAESGINLAMYYLQNPDNAPALNAAGYWGGTTSAVALGDGTVSVTITQDSSDSSMYEVTSSGAVGDAGTTGDTQMTRTEYARLNVVSEYQLKYATGINAAATFNGYTTVTGDVIANGSVTLKAPYARVTGTITSPSIPVYQSGYFSSWRQLPAAAIPTPTNNDINLYQTYTSGSSTYSASPLPNNATTLSGAAGVATLTSSATNPAGIWYSSGNLTLYDNVTINGTLVVNGSLTVSGANITINPTTGYPGLIVTGNLQINQTKKSMTVYGVCYVGGQLKSSGLYLFASDSSVLNVNGGLLINGGIPSSYNAATNVQLDPTMSKAPELSSAGRTPVGIKVVRWGPVVAAPY